MTRKALTTLLVPMVTLGIGCAEWSITPLQQTTAQRRSPTAGQPAPATVDPGPANAPTGDSIDAHGDTMAAVAVREYLADLDASKRKNPAPAAKVPAPQPEPRLEPRVDFPVVPQKAIAPPVDKPKSTEPAQVPERTPAAAPPIKPPVDRRPGRQTPADAIEDARGAVQANAPLTIDATRGTESTAPFETADVRRPQVVAVSLVGNTEPTEPVTGEETSANAAVDTASPPADTAALDQLIEQAAAELAKNPSDARVQWRLSLLQLAAGRPAEAGALSPELTVEQRGLLARQVAVNAAMEEVLGGSAEHTNQAYAATEALRDALRQDAELVLPVLTLCTKVTTFGVYSELSDSALVPYRANRAIVYCEVRNLATEGDSTRGYRSLLSTRLEMFGANGQSLWTHEEKRIDDVARRRREDFFIAQLVTFPATMAPGTYTLKATITDLIGEKTNEVTRELHVGGQDAAGTAPAPAPTVAPSPGPVGANRPR